MGDNGDESRSFLIDVSDVSLLQIEAIDDSVIGAALRGVLDDAAGPQSAVAGFDSFVDPERTTPSR